MEISPFLLSLLLINSFFLGIGLGVLNDVNRIVRVFFGVSYSSKSIRSLYTRNLPIVHRPLVRTEHGKIKNGMLAVLIFFQDLLLFAVGGVGLVLLQYEYNSGRFRFFCIPAILIGFLLYYFTLGKIVMLLSEVIVQGIRAFAWIVGWCILTPFVKIGRIFSKILIKFAKNIQILIAKRAKMLYNRDKKKEWLCTAEKGFLPRDV